MALPPGASRDQQVQNLATYIERKVPGAQGQQLASEYENYASAHPNITAASAYLGWLFSAVGHGLGKSLQDILGLSAKNAQQIAEGTGAGLDKTGQALQGGLAGIGDFFARLTEASTWERVGTAALGLILIAIGLARITKAVPVATKIAKTVGAVAI